MQKADMLMRTQLQTCDSYDTDMNVVGSRMDSGNHEDAFHDKIFDITYMRRAKLDNSVHESEISSLRQFCRFRV